MSRKMKVATRKGLFYWEEDSNGCWRITETAFIGDAVTLSYTDPRNGDCYAALNLGHFGVKLHRQVPGGPWQEIGVPAYPKAEEEDQKDQKDQKGDSLKLIWSLTCADDQQGTLWAGTIPGGLFKSLDYGETWSLMEGLWERSERAEWFGGGYDEPGIHSILVDPRDSSRLLLGISCGGVWESRDSGVSWTLHGEGLRAAYMPPEQAGEAAIQDPHWMVRCKAEPDVIWMQHHNGIFYSDSAGSSWREITNATPSAFGFATAVHPLDPKMAWFVPAVKDECRVPVDGKLVVMRTRDGGHSFETLSNGLPQEHAYDLTFRHALDVCAEGSHLAFGSTTGNLWLSSDQGDNWHLLSNHLPPIYAVSFDP